MKYETFITITYCVPVYSDHAMTREEVLEHIAENEVITEHKIVDIDYDNADIRELETA